MATSYNGCPAAPNPTNAIRDWGVQWNDKALTFPQGLGQTADMRACFQYLMEQWILRVEKPATGKYNVDGNWGGNYRANVNNPSQLSCHASWSALDYMATRHPNGSRNTYTQAQYAAIAAILEELEGVITVGIPGLRTATGRLVGWTTSSKPDEMHKEATHYNPAEWTRVANKIRPKLGKGPAGSASPEPAHQNEEGSITVAGLSAEAVQKLLNAAGATPALVVDNIYGAHTTAAVRAFQSRNKLRVDGVVGPVTYAALKQATSAQKPAVQKPMAFPLKNGQVFGLWNEPGVDSKTGKQWKSLTRSGDPRWDGADIRNLIKLIQVALQKCGLAPNRAGWADGLYEQPTKDAVKAFQKSARLAQDGLVGPATWAAIAKHF